MVDESRRTGSQASIKGVTVKDSTNVTVIAGNRNEVTQSAELGRGLELHPYTPTQYGLIGIGRWIMLRLYGTLDHSLKLYTLIVAALTVFTGAPFVVPAISNVHFGSLPLVLEMVDAVVLGILIVLGWGVIITARETRCPKCRKKFMYTRKSRVLEGRMNLQEKEVRNYRSTYSCDDPSCGYKRENVREIEELQKPEDA